MVQHCTMGDPISRNCFILSLWMKISGSIWRTGRNVLIKQHRAVGDTSLVCCCCSHFGHMQYKQKLSLFSMDSFGIAHFVTALPPPSAASPQGKWAVCSSPQTLQDGNLFLCCSVSSGELSQAILSPARGTGRCKRYFQVCCPAVHAGFCSETCPRSLKSWNSTRSTERYLLLSLTSDSTVTEHWSSQPFKDIGVMIWSSEHPLPSSQWQGNGGLSFVRNLSYWDKEDSVVKRETLSQWRGTKSHQVSHTFSPFLPHKHTRFGHLYSSS